MKNLIAFLVFMLIVCSFLSSSALYSQEKRAQISPEEFLKKLREGHFDREAAIRGIVKENAESPQSVLFALGNRCEGWIAIPVEKIDSVEVLTVLQCRDHSHPYVRLELKAPATEEGKLFSNLLKSSMADRVGFGSIVVGPEPPAPRSCDECELLRDACEASGGSVYECTFVFFYCLMTCY